jgi:hypothetical protein
MTEPVFSFVLDRSEIRRSFRGVAPREFLLALLAGIPPQDHWNGCEVGLGPSPLEPNATICVVTRGPGAEEAQVGLLAALERQEMTVARVYEGGPSTTDVAARAAGKKWVAP